jgi:hypothetical protein
MSDGRRAKVSKVAETQLVQAAELLFDPRKFEIELRTLKDYGVNLRNEELEEAMLGLERVAREHGAHAGLWRRMQKAAVTLNLHGKAQQYEKEFHDALAKNV